MCSIDMELKLHQLRVSKCQREFVSLPATLSLEDHFNYSKEQPNHREFDFLNIVSLSTYLAQKTDIVESEFVDFTKIVKD